MHYDWYDLMIETMNIKVYIQTMLIFYSSWLRLCIQFELDFFYLPHTSVFYQNIFSELRTPIQTNIETELKQTKKPLHAGGEHAAVNHTNTFFLFQHFSMF